MSKLIIISIILFLMSIISFFIKNWNKRLTLKQIIQLSGYNSKKTTYYKNYSDFLLMFSIVALILCFHYSILLEIIVGIIIVFTQKVLIFILQRIMFRDK